MLRIKKLAITGIWNAITNYTVQPKSINNKSFFTFLSECIWGEAHCTESNGKAPNKNICNDNVCECNTGYIPSQDSCIPCQPNQIVEKDSCNGNAVCKDCPVGMHPNIDRCKCIDDEISPIDGHTGDCVKGWLCPIFKTYTASQKKIHPHIT